MFKNYGGFGDYRFHIGLQFISKNIVISIPYHTISRSNLFTISRSNLFIVSSSNFKLCYLTDTLITTHAIIKSCDAKLRYYNNIIT